MPSCCWWRCSRFGGEPSREALCEGLPGRLEERVVVPSRGAALALERDPGRKPSAVLDTVLSNAAKDYPTDVKNEAWSYALMSLVALLSPLSRDRELGRIRQSGHEGCGRRPHAARCAALALQGNPAMKPSAKDYLTDLKNESWSHSVEPLSPWRETQPGSPPQCWTRCSAMLRRTTRTT